MHVTGALNYLKPHQKKALSGEFDLLYRTYAIRQDKLSNLVRERIMQMLGIDYIYGLKFKDHNSRQNSVYPAIQERGKAIEP